jgi:hypothetical protein
MTLALSQADEPVRWHAWRDPVAPVVSIVGCLLIFVGLISSAVNLSRNSH